MELTSFSISKLRRYDTFFLPEDEALCRTAMSPTAAPFPALTEGSKTFLATCFAPTSAPTANVPPSVPREALDANSRKYGGPYISVPRIEDIRLPAQSRSKDIVTSSSSSSFFIRVYWPDIPSPDERYSVLLYAHGGGWFRGSVNSHDQLCRHLAMQSKRVIISVDYRLSPEHVYPAHLDDVETAYRWILDHPHLDCKQIAVGGDSAGANLVAGLIIRLHSDGDEQKTVPIEHRPKQQVLMYPALNCTGTTTESQVKYATGYGLTTEGMRFFIRTYLGSDHHSDEELAALASKPEVSPLLHPDPKSLPPTLIISAECDPLVSEAEQMTAKLSTAGVPVNHIIYPGLVHAFLPFFDFFPESMQAVDKIASFLQ